MQTLSDKAQEREAQDRESDEGRDVPTGVAQLDERGDLLAFTERVAMWEEE
jgi:hypothetical protein